MIITEVSKLQTLCEEVSSVEEGEEIGAQLLKELTETKSGIGLAANQVGINKRVCVINVKEPLVLINPKIVETSEETFVFPEGCLSFPNKHHEGQLSFTANGEDINDAFECACVQHEIDHLDGVTMFDREWKQEPIKTEKKIGRNEKVLIACGDESKVMKYKKAEPLLEDGWTLVEA